MNRDNIRFPVTGAELKSALDKLVADTYAREANIKTYLENGMFTKLMYGESVMVIRSQRYDYQKWIKSITTSPMDRVYELDRDDIEYFNLTSPDKTEAKA